VPKFEESKFSGAIAVTRNSHRVDDARLWISIFPPIDCRVAIEGSREHPRIRGAAAVSPRGEEGTVVPIAIGAA